MSVNPQDYDREERKNTSWWSSRYKSISDGGKSLKQVRRLTMIDLLLLLVMLGVLIPWVLQMDKRIDAGSYKVGLEQHSRNGSLVLVLNIALPRSAEVETEGTIGWRISGGEGTFIYEEFDLPPLPGNSREFIYMINNDGSYQCEIIAGSDTVMIQIDEDK